jgi:hypothetical protein
MEPTKACPQCGQQILAAAVKCKHCHARLDGENSTANAAQPTTPVTKKKSPLRLIIIVVAALVVGGGGLAVAFVVIDQQEKEKAATEKATARTEYKKTTKQRERAAKMKKLANLFLLIDGDFKQTECHKLMGVSVELCLALAEAIEKGRTSRSGRKDLRKYLKDRGYFRLRGYIVARHGTGVYEIYRYGRRYHALLKTNATQYTTRGRFNLWAAKVGSREIKTKNGFTQTWDVFEEDAFGSTVQAIFSARAGNPTRDAARKVLKALASIAVAKEKGDAL